METAEQRQGERAERWGQREELLKRTPSRERGSQEVRPHSTSMSLVVHADGDEARLGGCRGAGVSR